jgi:hypothetical protein
MQERQWSMQNKVHKQITKRQEHQTRRDDTLATTYCVIIQTQRTQISVRNSNSTKHSGGPLEDGREKKPETFSRGFVLTNKFLTFYWF